MRILVAEDDDTNALLIGRMLKKLGHEYVRTRDGIEALATCQSQGPFDLVLTDWMMPNMDGLVLIAELRKVLRPAPPMVILTATASDQARSQALDAGADEYLAKPVRADELGRCIERALARSNHHPLELTPPSTLSPRQQAETNCPIVLLVAGTGGPMAIQKVLARTKWLASCCCVILQHGPAWMVETFSHRLQGRLEVTVCLAEHGSRVEAGLVYLAPGGHHLRIAESGQSFLLTDEPEVNHVRPSADPLLKSATAVAKTATAVIFTGIGCDGAEGALRFTAAGGTLAVQDPASSEVGAMPQSVIDTGGGPRVFPLDHLAAYIDAQIASHQENIKR